MQKILEETLKSNNFAVSSSDLEQGLANVASTMASSGTTYEQTLGMLTAITERTRNANKASRGLRQITSRLMQTMDEGSSTGKKLVGIYSDLGIALTDSDGQLRGTYEILGDLAKQWGGLDKNTQEYIALTSSGANQLENFYALMSGFSTATQATATALGSAGSAEKENEKYLDSLEARVNGLKQALEALVLGDGGTLQGLLKVIISVGTEVLKLANTDFVKFYASAFAIVGVIYELAKAKKVLNLASWLDVIPQVGKAFSSLGFAIQTVATGEWTLVEATTALSVAEKAIAVTAIITALFAIYEGIKAVVEAQDRLIDNANDAVQAWQDETQKVGELEDKLKSLDDQISAIQNKGYISLTDQAQLDLLEKQKANLEQQLEIQKSLAEIAKNKADAEVNKAMTDKNFYQTENVGENSDGSTYINKDIKRGTIMDEVSDDIKGYQELQTELNKTADEYNKLLEKKANNGNLTKQEESNLSMLETKMETYQSQLSSTGTAITDNQDDIIALAQAYFDAGVSVDELPDGLREAYEGLSNVNIVTGDVIEKITDSSSMFDELSSYIGEEVNNLDDVADKLSLTKEQEEELQNLIDDGNYVQAYAKALEYGAGAVDGLTTEEDELADSTEDSINALQEQLSAITSLYDSYGTLQQAVADFNTNGYINPSNLKELLSLGDEYLSLLQITDGQLSINEAGFEALANAQYDKAEADAYEEYAQKMTALAQAEAKGTLDELQTATNSYSTESMNAQLQNLCQNLGLAIDGFNELAVASTKVNIKTSQGKDLAKQYSSSLQTQLTFIEAGRKGIGKHTASIKSNTKATGSNTSSRKSNTGSTKSNTDAQKANTEALKKNVDALKKQKEAIEKEKEDMEKVISYIEDKVNDYVDELEDAKDAEVDLIDDALDGLDDIKDALDDAFDEDKINKLNKIMDKSVKKLNELNDELQKLRSEGKNTTGVEKEIEALNKSLEIQKQIIQYKKTAEDAQAEKKRIENEIDKLKEENDELEEQLEYKQLLDNLAKAQQTRLKVYKEGQGFVYTEDQSAISEAQKALDEWLRKKKLDDQIKQLEDQRDKQKEIYDQQAENLDNLQDDCDELYDQMNKDLEQYKNQVEKRWDDQINYYKNWLEEFKKGVNSYETEQNRLLALEKTGIDFEQQGWQTRLSNLSSFVESYKAKLAELEEATRRLNEAQQAYEQAQAQASASGVSSGGGGGSSSGGGGGGYSPAPASTPAPAPSKVTPLKGRVYSYNSGLNYRFIEGNDRSPKVTTTAWQHGFKVQKVFANGSAYVLTKSGKLALVQASEWNSDKVRKTAGTKAYASGASSIQDDQMALVGDSPTNNELVIGSKLNGQFMNLKKGSGVVNATSTNTLAGLLNQLPKLTGHSINATTNNNTSSNDTVFSIGNITIDGANITDITSFKNALINIKSEAVQRAYQH